MAQEEEEGEIRCICGSNEDDGFTIQCDKCGVWQHAVCVDITQETVPDCYLCDKCSPKETVKKIVKKSPKKSNTIGHLVYFEPIIVKKPDDERFDPFTEWENEYLESCFDFGCISVNKFTKASLKISSELQNLELLKFRDLEFPSIYCNPQVLGEFDSGAKQYGLMACLDIPPNTFITEIKGIWSTQRDLDAKSLLTISPAIEKGKILPPFVFKCPGTDLFLDSRWNGAFDGRFVRSTCNAPGNAKLVLVFAEPDAQENIDVNDKLRLCLFSQQEIKKDTEVLLGVVEDYFGFACTCCEDPGCVVNDAVLEMEEYKNLVYDGIQVSKDYHKILKELNESRQAISEEMEREFLQDQQDLKKAQQVEPEIPKLQESPKTQKEVIEAPLETIEEEKSKKVFVAKKISLQDLIKRKRESQVERDVESPNLQEQSGNLIEEKDTPEPVVERIGLGLEMPKVEKEMPQTPKNNSSHPVSATIQTSTLVVSPLSGPISAPIADRDVKMSASPRISPMIGKAADQVSIGSPRTKQEQSPRIIPRKDDQMPPPHLKRDDYGEFRSPNEEFRSRRPFPRPPNRFPFYGREPLPRDGFIPRDPREYRETREGYMREAYPPRDPREVYSRDPRDRDNLRDGGYPSREPPRDGYMPREGGFPLRDPRDIEYLPRDPRDKGFPPRDSGYPPRDPRDFPPRDPRDVKYPPRDAREGGFPPRDSPGYIPPFRRDMPRDGYPYPPPGARRGDPRDFRDDRFRTNNNNSNKYQKRR